MRTSSHLEGLNSEQRKAASIVDGPLLIVAGAGAGKTKTITHRIAHIISSGVAPWNILAVTFTNKAAAEMRERVRKLLGEGKTMPLMTTFHALGARLLREFYEDAKLPRGFVIWDRDDQIRSVKRILGSLDIDDIKPAMAISAISKQKSMMRTPATFASNSRSYRDRFIVQIWEMYEKHMLDDGALDFDDLVGKTLELLQKEHIRLKLQSRWTHITIDEYQDTSAQQFEIVQLLAGEKRNLCVVGDADQCVYSWRQAKIENLLQFEKHFPGAMVVTLEQNYRSTRTILSAANAVIEKNVKRPPKKLFTDNEVGEPITLYGARNEADESWFIAHHIRNLLDSGIRASEVAVLYRENFQSRVIEEALLQSGISYKVLGTRFFERAEVKDLLSYLRIALNPQSKQDFLRVCVVPSKGIGKTTIEKIFAGKELELPAGMQKKLASFRAVLAGIRHACETLTASEAVRFAAEASGVEAMLKDNKEDGAERLANIFELVNIAVRFDELPSPEGVERLLEQAALESDQDNRNENEEAVSLMTVHASKGLEFDAVFVTGLEQGLFPSIRQNDSDRDNEEERRLFYVAVTRARKRLFLSYATERMKYGKRDVYLQSEFLMDIDDRLLSESRPKPPKMGLLDFPTMD